jgi:hypothetical protein
MRVIEMELEGFKKRFPNYWNPDSNYETSLIELKDYITRIQNQIPDVEIHEFKVKERMVKYFSSKQVKKIINKTPKS